MSRGLATACENLRVRSEKTGSDPSFVKHSDPLIADNILPIAKSGLHAAIESTRHDAEQSTSHPHIFYTHWSR
jgi:hypothetical protein